jgi:hypothetical protein
VVRTLDGNRSRRCLLASFVYWMVVLFNGAVLRKEEYMELRVQVVFLVMELYRVPMAIKISSKMRFQETKMPQRSKSYRRGRK